MTITTVLNRVNRLERNRGNYKAFVYRPNSVHSVTPRVELITADMYKAYKAENEAAIDRVTELPEQLFEVVWFDSRKEQPSFDDWLDALQADYDSTLDDFLAGTGRV